MAWLWPEGWSSVLCLERPTDSFLPSFRTCCLLPSWLPVPSFSLSLGSLPSLLALVLECGKLMVLLDVP